MGFFANGRGFRNFEANLNAAMAERKAQRARRPVDASQGLAKPRALRDVLDRITPTGRGDVLRTNGVVRFWHSEQGWGVLDSPDTPNGCWAHFAAIVMDGYKSLDAGEPVTFTFVKTWQDGYDYQAQTVGRYTPGAHA